jgi:hypothetical protein
METQINPDAPLKVEDPMHFITIRWDAESGELVLDLGDLSHYEAWGILAAALQEVEDRCPSIEVRFNGESWGSSWDDEEEE